MMSAHAHEDYGRSVELLGRPKWVAPHFTNPHAAWVMQCFALLGEDDDMEEVAMATMWEGF
jgi:hypothetical protein